MLFAVVLLLGLEAAGSRGESLVKKSMLDEELRFIEAAAAAFGEKNILLVSEAVDLLTCDGRKNGCAAPLLLVDNGTAAAATEPFVLCIV